MAKVKHITDEDGNTYDIEGAVTDISDTTSTIDSIQTEYPDITASDKASTLFGKIKKFLADLKSKVNSLNSDLANKQDAATAITTSNIGSQSVNYANQSHLLRSYQPDSWGGASYGDAFQIKSQYDGTFFCLKCVDSNYAVKVDRADWAQPVFNNATWYVVGDDVRIGDQNVGGALCLQGITDNTALCFISQRGDSYGTLSYGNDSMFHIGSWLSFPGGNTRVYGANGILYLGANTTARVVNYNNTAFAPISASAFNVGSSRIIKENVVDTTDDDAIKILNLRVVNFDYINGDKSQCGLIAEEVVDIIPHCVRIPDKYSEELAKKQLAKGELPDVPSIDYSKLVAPIIRLVQIQQKEIDNLKQTINSLLQ